MELQTLAGAGVVSEVSSVTGLMPELERVKWLGAYNGLCVISPCGASSLLL